MDLRQGGLAWPNDSLLTKQSGEKSVLTAPSETENTSVLHGKDRTKQWRHPRSAKLAKKLKKERKRVTAKKAKELREVSHHQPKRDGFRPKERLRGLPKRGGDDRGPGMEPIRDGKYRASLILMLRYLGLKEKCEDE